MVISRRRSQRFLRSFVHHEGKHNVADRAVESETTLTDAHITGPNESMDRVAPVATTPIAPAAHPQIAITRPDALRCVGVSGNDLAAPA